MSDDGFVICCCWQCLQCGCWFSIIEIVSFSVIKCSGIVEFFSCEKIIFGVCKVCQGCLVSDVDFVQFVQKVEELIWVMGVLQIEVNDIGLLILLLFCEFDEVVYFWFVSVYQGFDLLDDFEVVIMFF